MSGIAGILRRDGRPIPEKWVQWLESAIVQRGSDSAGKFEDAVEIAAGTLEIVLLHQQMGASVNSQPYVFAKDDQPYAALVIDGPTDCVSNEKVPITFPHDAPYAAAMWNANELQVELIRGGSGQKPLYMLDLGEAGDGIVFCSVPTPLIAIASELDLGCTDYVLAVQQYFQLGFVSGDHSLISPVKSVPVHIDKAIIPTTDQTPVQHSIAGSPAPAEDLLALVSQLGQPFTDESLLSRYWIYKAEGELSQTIRHGLLLDATRLQDAQSLASWHGLRSLWPSQSTAKDWVKLGITSLDAMCSISMIEKITGHAFDTPSIPRSDGSIKEQLEQFNAEVRTPDCMLRGIDAAAMAARVDVLVDAISDPYAFEPLPLATWFRSEQGDFGQLAGDVFTSTDPFDNLPIENAVVSAMFEDHRSGRASYEKPLFALLTLSLWLRLASSP